MDSQLFKHDSDEATVLPDSSREGSKLLAENAPQELSASSKFIPQT